MDVTACCRADLQESEGANPAALRTSDSTSTLCFARGASQSDINGNEAATSTVRFYPYGEYRVTPTSDLTDKGFTGHAQNDEVALIYMRARYCVPGVGRFASADSIVPNPLDPQNLNRYGYVGNSPMNCNDPSGHCAICVGVGIVIGLVVWLANPPTVYAPEADWTPSSVMEDPYYGDKAYFETAPGSGDVSDIYAAITGYSLYTNEPRNRLVAGFFAVLPFATHGLKYLRHGNIDAFETLLSLGSRNADEIDTILNTAGSDSVIRSMTDRVGNQIILQAGSRDGGLRHIIGRHLTGTIPGNVTTFFPASAKVGDITNAIADTVRNGTQSRASDTGNLIYTWTNQAFGEMKVIVSKYGEVISAYPTK